MAAQQQPFCLIISLVNPHDVLTYPKNYINGGYDDSWLVGDIGLPETYDEDLSTKPDAQAEFLKIFNLSGPLPTDQMKINYLNFYGNLMKSSDKYLVNVLDSLKATGLLDKTLIIRTADHGEMGLAHGGLRQKNFNFYEESLRVPYVYSNPLHFTTPHSSSAMISHVDLLPTLASLFHAPESARANWQGVDYSRLVNDPGSGSVQDYIAFTFDDYQSGQASGPYVQPPNHIVSIREERFKLAEYYDASGTLPSQWEMYDLQADPLETHNLAYQIHKKPRAVQAEYARLRGQLEVMQAKRLQPLS